jgi:hypothetical protein
MALRRRLENGAPQDAVPVCHISAPKPKPPETPAPSAEGVGSFLEGAVAGDFSENDSWSAVAGQTAVGFIPIVGQIADARDIAAAASAVYNDEDGSWARLGIAAIAIVPGLDFLKAGSRVGRKALKEVAEEGLTQTSQAGLKRLGRDMSKEGIARAEKELVTLSVGRTEMMGRLDDLTKSGILSPVAQSRVQSAYNSLKDHLTQDDLVGALRDKNSLPVRRSGDGYTWDHLGEVESGIKSLDKAKDEIIKDMRRHEPNSSEYKRLSAEAEALSEIAERIQRFTEIK